MPYLYKFQGHVSAGLTMCQNSSVDPLKRLLGHRNTVHFHTNATELPVFAHITCNTSPYEGRRVTEKFCGLTQLVTTDVHNILLLFNCSSISTKHVMHCKKFVFRLAAMHIAPLSLVNRHFLSIPLAFERNRSHLLLNVVNMVHDGEVRTHSF